MGEKIGTVNYYYDNKLISKSDIVLKSKFKMSIKKVIIKYYYIIIGIPLLLVFIRVLIKRKKDLTRL